MKADVLREKFLAFFKARQHKIVQSDSLVPGDDPTVLFTPAGMNQFKREFMGVIADFRRAASSQRCLRTDDLDKVGKTRGHHTFFEMLGNFSFGDYFKKEAIAWAWEFLTQELSIDPQRLWVSVYKDDEEAYMIWKDTIKLPGERIVRMGDKENFWPSEAKEKGPNGPCGPCSEIYFDQGQAYGCARASCDPSCSCGRFLEVWNLVFTQFNRQDAGMLEPLPQKNIDTGMGLERLAAVMQGVASNFQTDLFTPIIQEISSSARAGVVHEKELLYAIADHLRAIVFSLYDGVLPSNEARGYVVRKILRKSVLHLGALGIKEPFLYRLVPVLAEVMKQPYPELAARRENIAEIILAEEKNFISTLNTSESLLQEKFRTVEESKDPQQAGAIAFQLYDTYGIPLELTSNWLKARGIPFSQETFTREMQEQKLRSKAQSQMRGDVFSKKDADLGIKESRFLGYREYLVEAKILKLLRDSSEGESREIKEAHEGEKIKIILDRTPFYPESGGQSADTGQLTKGESVFEITDTRRMDKVIVHVGLIRRGSFAQLDAVLAKIDVDRRLAIARNHTATHLLQAALRQVLGPHVRQQGSLVAADRLRFDFTHFKDIPASQLDRIEETVNSYVLGNFTLKTEELSLQEARSRGALAFFGEKYEEMVRMVSVGDAISTELCGGTHLDSTGQVGLFKIVGEGSAASGVRRIEAVTGSYAYAAMKAQEQVLQDACALLNTQKDRVVQELQKKLRYLKDLEKEVIVGKEKELKGEVAAMIASAERAGNTKVIALRKPGLTMELLRKAVDLIKQEAKEKVVIALGSAVEDKAFLVIALNFSAADEGIDASQLIKEVAPEIGGSGGGRKDFAQAGGIRPQGLEKAFVKLKQIIAQSP